MDTSLWILIWSKGKLYHNRIFSVIEIRKFEIEVAEFCVSFYYIFKPKLLYADAFKNISLLFDNLSQRI